MIFKHPRFYSPQLDNTRTITVWAPDHYDLDASFRYPVIYMQDGQNVLEEATSFAGIAWRTDRAIEKLVARGVCKPALIVAIDSNESREDEYDFKERGEAYARFLVETVKPFIDREYRTDGGRDATLLMGASLGATISFEILWKHPEVFSKAAGLSLPAFYHDESIFELFRERGKPSQPVRLYFDHGTRGQDRWYAKSAKSFHQLLLKLGLNEQDVVYRKFPGDDHTEADWGRRCHIPLERFLSAKALKSRASGKKSGGTVSRSSAGHSKG